MKRQANMFAETCEDLPIFSGAAPRCKPATFDPQPEVRTEPLFDMRPIIGQLITGELVTW